MFHEVLLRTMPQVASRAPVGVRRQIEVPSAKSRSMARQVQSAAVALAACKAAKAQALQTTRRSLSDIF